MHYQAYFKSEYLRENEESPTRDWFETYADAYKYIRKIQKDNLKDVNHFHGSHWEIRKQVLVRGKMHVVTDSYGSF